KKLSARLAPRFLKRISHIAKFKPDSSGLDPGIHDFRAIDVDGRVKPGHDGKGTPSPLPLFVGMRIFFA
ncbi:MAG: hypothetical protein WC722_09405, partial [Rhodospirillales bacterium]